MESNVNFKDKLYERVHTFSKRFLSFKHKFTRLVIKTALNSIFGILIYLSVSISAGTYDQIFLAILIASAIIISFLVDFAWEDSEYRELKRQTKIFSRTFTLLNDDYKTAMQNIKSRDEFLSIVSHELKTPLTVMLLKLRSELTDIKSASLANFSVPKLIDVLKNSEKQINWLKSIVNDLLDVSLITTGRMNLDPEEINIADLTKQVRQSFSEIIRREKYKIKIDAQTPVVGKWDKVRLEQVITNLFSNALKYGNGKPIFIKITKTGDSAKFIIKDSGIGIKSEELKVIFDLFKRANGAETYKKGLGVGLFITSQIVKIHGGKIRVSSKHDKGTSFTVELPLKK